MNLIGQTEEFRLAMIPLREAIDARNRAEERVAYELNRLYDLYARLINEDATGTP